MFLLHNHHQATFVYGPEIYEKLIPEDHIPCKISKQVDFSFVNEACKDLYSQNQGRTVLTRNIVSFGDSPVHKRLLLFFAILKQIEDAGFAKGNQSTDATHVIANIAIP
jgi:IS5 family transposase